MIVLKSISKNAVSTQKLGFGYIDLCKIQSSVDKTRSCNVSLMPLY